MLKYKLIFAYPWMALCSFLILNYIVHYSYCIITLLHIKLFNSTLVYSQSTVVHMIWCIAAQYIVLLIRSIRSALSYDIIV